MLISNSGSEKAVHSLVFVPWRLQTMFAGQNNYTPLAMLWGCFYEAYTLFSIALRKAKRLLYANPLPLIKALLQHCFFFLSYRKLKCYFSRTQ